MMNEIKRNIEKLVYNCFKEITNHTLQSEIISPHIKNINHNLENILKNLEALQDSRLNYKPHSGERMIVRSTKKNALIKIAYAMSRFDYHIINDILKNKFNQTEAFQYLAEKLNVKMATLRNYRDMFDPYVKQKFSNRMGWHQKELSPEFQAIKNEYDNKDEATIKNEIETILNNPDDL
jgi:hypothetical protein